MFYQRKYRPDANKITFMHVSEGQLYAATVADFSGGEPLIHREKIRTERSDLNQLNGNGRHANCIRIFPPGEHDLCRGGEIFFRSFGILPRFP